MLAAVSREYAARKACDDDSEAHQKDSSEVFAWRSTHGRIDDDPCVFLRSRIASHYDPAGRGLRALLRDEPVVWSPPLVQGTEPSPRSAVFAANTSAVLSTIARSMTHSMLLSKTQSQYWRISNRRVSQQGAQSHRRLRCSHIKKFGGCRNRSL